MSRLDLVAAVVIALLLLVILLQTVLNRQVWSWYLIALVVVALAWVATSDWLLAAVR